MALSDQLAKLAEQTRALEASAADLEAEDAAKVDARLASLHQSIEAFKGQLGDDLIADGHGATDDWVTMQKKVSDAFNSIHARAAAHRASRKAKRAESVAEESEWDAADAVDFAIYAVQEAEYTLLQAAADRDTADRLKS
ncbi:MAG: hypothetical protein JWO18_2742 [Microbacteriaceae bacterium]|nr:hypothetical protein [Microbacteriaceae bacterium]